jgi:hypothetical protein
MLQGDKSSHTDKQKRRAEPIELGFEEKGVDTKSAEARIWDAANKLTRADEEQFREQQE